MRQITAYAAVLHSVREAASRIAPYAHRTPVMTCLTIDELAGCRLYFKCELFQKTGSFKFRGACNAVMKLSDEEAQRGVVTHSSGNHAQALALAAKLRGCQVHIVMPRTASPIKRQSVEGYGGKIYLCEPTLAARESMAAELAEQTGAVMIPPYDHPDIIAGQGTAALELLEQIAAQEGEPLPPLRREGREVGDDPHPSPLPGREREFALDAIIAPIGGGGLISGTCITAKAINPNIHIFAAEPAGADDAARSLAAGRLIPQTNPNTICDGLLTSLGELTWPIVRDHVQRIITVDDEKIIAAMRLIWQRMKLIIEPSAAVAVAAVLSDEFKSLPLGSSPTSGGVGVILSGGNSDLDHLPW